MRKTLQGILIAGLVDHDKSALSFTAPVVNSSQILVEPRTHLFVSMLDRIVRGYHRFLDHHPECTQIGTRRPSKNGECILDDLDTAFWFNLSPKSPPSPDRTAVQLYFGRVAIWEMPLDHVIKLFDDMVYSNLVNSYTCHDKMCLFRLPDIPGHIDIQKAHGQLPAAGQRHKGSRVGQTPDGMHEGTPPDCIPKI